MTLTEFKAATETLTPAERRELAEHLWESADELGDPSDEFDRELERRIAEIDAGRATGAPMDEAFSVQRQRFV